jgi:transcriptional regulator with GAF, ATPase, and Fis domain
VAVNCGAIPETLVESELFGYRRGAFTEAREDRPGLIRSAEKGTLFLDEIGDLPLSSQVKFLRVLQEREVLPVGATRPVSVDIRLVAATHHDLARRVAEGAFRPDLYGRISGFAITLPPLRRRREDLGTMIARILCTVEGTDGVRFTNEAARAIFRYDWPLNVRELEKCLRTAVVMARAHDLTVEADDLPREVQAALLETDTLDTPTLDEGELTQADRERRSQLVSLLAETGGNVSAVARRMGKARMQVQRWIRRYRVDLEAFRSKP